MAKFFKRDKINYLKSAKSNMEQTLSIDNKNNNNNCNNDINSTLTNISKQLKNIALYKNKDFKLINCSFNMNHRSIKNNVISNIQNNPSNNENCINTSMNKSNFWDITGNSQINSNRFQNLKRIRVSNFIILKNEDDTNYEDIKKENLELKENIKFLLRQVKKYQKSGLTIEDMNINRQIELNNLEKKMYELTQEINIIKNKNYVLEQKNKELTKENNELKYNMQFQSIKKDKYFDFDRNNLYNANNNNALSIQNRSKLSEEMINNISNNDSSLNNKDNIFNIIQYNKNIGKPKSNKSEGKLYHRKSIGNKFLSFNEELYNRQNRNNKTYSKTYLRYNINYKKQS